MQLKSVKFDKVELYDIYDAIVIESKDYDNITKSKMIDEIIKQYHVEKYLLCMCTKRELDFLDYALKKKVKISDYLKYGWEIESLNKKCIFCPEDSTIYEELLDVVKESVALYKNSNYNVDETVAFLVGFVKVHGSIPVMALEQIFTSMSGMTEETFKQLIYGNPLFNFYCDFYDEYLESLKKEVTVVYYRDYFDILDELDVARKEFGIGGSKPFDPDIFMGFFYDKFPVKNNKVKKMVKYIEENIVLPELTYRAIDFARVLNDRSIYHLLEKDDKKLIELIDDALDEMPCSAMNGFTPKQWREKQEKKANLDIKFTNVPQNNAHLCKKAADEFYKLYFALLEYTNDLHNINANIKKIYRQEGLNAQDLFKIDKYLWEHKDVIDAFIEDNVYHFTEDELSKIADFKTAVSSDHFVIVGFEREYTEILSDDGKLYMVKGIRADFSELINDPIPLMINTTLLMFDGKIIFNSFFATYPIDAGVDMAEAVFEEKEKAIKYYHL